MIDTFGDPVLTINLVPVSSASQWFSDLVPAVCNGTYTSVSYVPFLRKTILLLLASTSSGCSYTLVTLRLPIAFSSSCLSAAAQQGSVTGSLASGHHRNPGMRRPFLWGSILLSLCLFLLCGVDSTFGRSGMDSADVSRTGGTEYLSIKVVHVIIFSRSMCVCMCVVGAHVP